MNTFKIGDVIKKTRIDLGITQEQLAEGICSVSSLSKIENNTQVPSKANFDALMQRMGKSGEIYYAFVSEKDFEIQEIKYKIRNHLIAMEYDKANELIQKLEKEKESKESLNKQFILYMKAIIKKSKGEDLETVLDLLHSAIKITIPNFNEKKLCNYLLTDDDITIINNIAVVYSLMNHRRKAINLLYEVIDYIEDNCIDTKSKVELLPMIFYNLSKWLDLEHRYEEAIEICNLGIDNCNKHGKLVGYGEIIMSKACILYNIGNRDESLKYLKRAYFIFDSQENIKYASMVEDYAKDKFKKNLRE